MTGKMTAGQWTCEEGLRERYFCADLCAWEEGLLDSSTERTSDAWERLFREWLSKEKPCLDQKNKKRHP